MELESKFCIPYEHIDTKTPSFMTNEGEFLGIKVLAFVTAKYCYRIVVRCITKFSFKRILCLEP